MSNEYNSADTFNRMFRESGNNGYQTSYTRVKNNSYGNNNNTNNSKNSNAKVITYIFVGGIILYYAYKNVLKPAAKVVNNVLNLFNPEEDEKPNVRSYAKYSERVLNGEVTRISNSEAKKLKRSSLVAYEDPNNPDHYILDYI
jgi:hypothetical protein